MKKYWELRLWVLTMTLLLAGCDKGYIENEQTVRELYKIYKNGSISKCTFNGQTVYSAGLNATDAGGTVYDKDGKPIGTCNYAWGQVDPICGQLSACEVIYRVKDNIWGQPAVDKYWLGR